MSRADAAEVRVKGVDATWARWLPRWSDGEGKEKGWPGWSAGIEDGAWVVRFGRRKKERLCEFLRGVEERKRERERFSYLYNRF